MTHLSYNSIIEFFFFLAEYFIWLSSKYKTKPTTTVAMNSKDAPCWPDATHKTYDQPHTETIKRPTPKGIQTSNNTTGRPYTGWPCTTHTQLADGPRSPHCNTVDDGAAAKRSLHRELWRLTPGPLLPAVFGRNLFPVPLTWSILLSVPFLTPNFSPLRSHALRSFL